MKLKCKIQLKYLSVIFSVAGITLLYFLSTLSQPVMIELCEIPEYEGKQVIVEGIVTEHHVTSYGSHIITLEDDNATTTVFVEEKTNVEYGDKIQATGKVQKYEGDWEIIVGNVRFVTIVQKWQNITIPLWQLAENPTKYDGLNVNVTGFIDAVYDTYFYLVDTEEEHSIIVFYARSGDNVFYPGQKVNVAATFTFDLEDFRYRLIVSEETHGIFTTNG